MCFLFFKQRTAYERRISDWSSGVCSSDLRCAACGAGSRAGSRGRRTIERAGGRLLDGPEGRVLVEGVVRVERGHQQAAATVEHAEPNDVVDLMSVVHGKRVYGGVAHGGPLRFKKHNILHEHLTLDH